MWQNGKLIPNVDQHQQSTKILNLTVLQRIDPFVEEILITAAHVTLYDFNMDLHQWSRKDVEGPLFVVKRNAQPRFQFIVMNRRNTDNLVEDLLGDFEYDVQLPYVLYRSTTQDVNGIWFYNEDDCEAVANLFSRILNAYSKVPPKSKVSSAKSDFEELEAVQTLSIMEGPLEPPMSSAATIPRASDESFVNFFSAAANVGNALNAAIPGKPYQPCETICSHNPNVIPSSLPTRQPGYSMPNPSTPLLPLLDKFESNSSSNRAANLIKPSLFAPPPSAPTVPLVSFSTPITPPLHPPMTMQRPYGTPLLQPFPPPTPPQSLTPTPNYAPVITREKVRDALLRLVQNNQFIDMVYREMLNTHHS